ncbi:MAG: DivIVA domain-containing protein, partial [Ilumatobacteraceae bacterium]
MELSPQSVATTSFKTVKRGYDPDEVRSYLATLSKSIETLQNQATAMEARARAAVARLQEIAAQPTADPQRATVLRPDDSETISRTLLLAQRTADATVTEAEAEARRCTEAADAEANRVVDDAQQTAKRMVKDAKAEARLAAEDQRVEIESEVQSLLARREFLLSDVDHLEMHLVAQRDRLRDVANALTDIVTRVPDGLGDVHRPLVSAVSTMSTVSTVSTEGAAAPVTAVPDLTPTTSATTVM